MRPRTIFIKSLLIFSFLWLGYAKSIYAVDVIGMRVWGAPDNTRLVLDLSNDTDHKFFTLDNPSRAVIDLKANNFFAHIDEIGLMGTNINSIRYAKKSNNNLRIVLDLNQKVSASSFILKPNAKYGYRLVVDLIPKLPQIKLPNKSNLDSLNHLSKKFIVAIDPGHGGEDPGAIGIKYHAKEKDIVLDVSKRLEKIINDKPNCQAFLIRTGDYYVPLRKRMELARLNGADLFVSLHADSFTNPKANGASIYIVSEKGASSEAASWLAAKENSADLVGGVSLDDKSDILAKVLLDLSQTANTQLSEKLATNILSKLSSVTALHKEKVQKAGFVVLKAPDIPSVLIELGFISNKRGEAKLRQARHQTKLALAISDGIDEYLTTRAKSSEQ